MSIGQDGLKYLWIFLIAITIIGISIYAMILASQEMKEVGYEDATATVAVERINLTISTNALTQIKKTDMAVVNCSITNATGGEGIPSNNYTVYVNGTDDTTFTYVMGTVNSPWLSEFANVSCNFSYHDMGYASIAAINMTTGLGDVSSNFSSWVTLVAVVVLIAVAFIIVTAVIKRRMENS